MNLSLDWATLNQRIQEYGEKSDDADTVLGDNVSLVPVEGAGRGLRAERDLAGGQVVLEDWALAVGPTEISEPGDCSGCSLLPASGQCGQCGLGFCIEACKQRHHSGTECGLVTRLPLPRAAPAAWLPVLRLELLTREASTRDVLRLVAPGDIEPDTSKLSLETLERLGVSREQSYHHTSVLQNNAFRRGRGRVLCPAMAMVNHSCDPNCRVYWASPGDRLVLETRRKVQKGEELTITYCCLSLGTPGRHSKLLSGKGFRCLCKRCRDPGERGTNTGGVTCTRCREGTLLPNLEGGEWVWRCGCGFTANTEKVDKLFEKFQKELNLIDSMEESSHVQIQSKAEKYKSFIEKKSKMLPENSYILLTAKGSWSILLGKVKNDLKMLLKREAMTRKRLQVMELLDGGNRSRLRGYELFRLYQILEQKSKISGNEETESLKSIMTASLLESYFLLRHDLLAPPPLMPLMKKLRAEDPEMVESVLKKMELIYS